MVEVLLGFTAVAGFLHRFSKAQHWPCSALLIAVFYVQGSSALCFSAVRGLVLASSAQVGPILHRTFMTDDVYFIRIQARVSLTGQQRDMTVQ